MDGRPPVKIDMGQKCPKCGSKFTRSHLYYPRDPAKPLSGRFFDGCWACGFRGSATGEERA